MGPIYQLADITDLSGSAYMLPDVGALMSFLMVKFNVRREITFPRYIVTYLCHRWFNRD